MQCVNGLTSALGECSFDGFGAYLVTLMFFGLMSPEEQFVLRGQLCNDECASNYLNAFEFLGEAPLCTFLLFPDDESRKQAEDSFAGSITSQLELLCTSDSCYEKLDRIAVKGSCTSLGLLRLFQDLEGLASLDTSGLCANPCRRSVDNALKFLDPECMVCTRLWKQI